MIYVTTVSIAPSTSRAAPETKTIELVPGTIRHVEVEFPDGCAGLAHCQIWRWGHQLWPSNPGASFASNAYVVSWDEDFSLKDWPHDLRVEAWNLDDTYSHTLRVRVVLIPFRTTGLAGIHTSLGAMLSGQGGW